MTAFTIEKNFHSGRKKRKAACKFRKDTIAPLCYTVRMVFAITVYDHAG